MTTTTKITGGKKGFVAAIRAAYYGCGLDMQNPAVAYSQRAGFYVQPVTASTSAIWLARAAYHADSGDATIRPRDYAEVCETIDYLIRFSQAKSGREAISGTYSGHADSNAVNNTTTGENTVAACGGYNGVAKIRAWLTGWMRRGSLSRF